MNKFRYIIRVGSNCNNNCVFCWQDAISPKSLVDVAELKRIIGGITDEQSDLVFSGGEPTLHPHLFPLLSYAKEQDKFRNILIISNGRIFSIASFLEKTINSGATGFIISISSFDEGIHDGMTRSPGSFKQTVQGIKNIGDANIPFQSNTLILKPTIHLLPKMVEWLTSFNVSQINLGFPHLCGGARKYYNQLVPRYSDAVPFIRKSIETGEQLGVRVETELFPPCFIPQYAHHCSKKGMPELKVYESPDLKELKEEEDADFINLPSCSSCKHLSHCFGLPQEYIDREGLSEFKA